MKAITRNIGSPGVLRHEVVVDADNETDRLFVEFSPRLDLPPFYVGLPVLVKEAEGDDNCAPLTIDSVTPEGYYVNFSAPLQEGQIIRNIFIPA